MDTTEKGIVSCATILAMSQSGQDLAQQLQDARAEAERYRATLERIKRYGKMVGDGQLTHVAAYQRSLGAALLALKGTDHD